MGRLSNSPSLRLLWERGHVEGLRAPSIVMQVSMGGHRTRVDFPSITKEKGWQSSMG